MNNTEKLLRTLIEASGYEIEEVETIGKFYKQEDLNYCDEPKLGVMPEFTVKNIDYKVTKKKKEIDRIDIYLYTYLEINKGNLINARMYFYEIGSNLEVDMLNAYQQLCGDMHPTPNPIVADSIGRFPKVFISKPYRVEIRSSFGDLIFEDEYDEQI